MKFFTGLALVAFGVLSCAAVWMGGLNQDEGWYLYAANLVAEGQVPYRDFAYTQGPLLPYVYSTFAWVWRAWGLLGARVFTIVLGAFGILFACALARRLAPPEHRTTATLVAFILLGTNIYHLYYLCIPKTYALAALFVMAGFYLFSFASSWTTFAAGVALAFAAGARISLGILLAVVGIYLLLTRQGRRLALFSLGGVLALALVYGPFVLDVKSFAGLMAAQAYHTARGGFDPVWTVGSFSRLIRWYLPVFLLLVVGGFRQARLALAGFGTVFVVQMLAPFPYEDYQVPIMGLLAVCAAVNFTTGLSALSVLHRVWLVMALCCALSFGSPLLEQWSTNGQDRFWSLKKDCTELAQLRKTAARINQLNPGGKTLLTQDLYLAIETNRKVPHGLEMGPFSILSDDGWRALLLSAPCPIAALSGYTFAIEPPACHERPIKQQMEYWDILKQNYTMLDRVEAFGQNHTTLLLLKHK